jgi:hypothetical protein
VTINGYKARAPEIAILPLKVDAVELVVTPGLSCALIGEHALSIGNAIVNNIAPDNTYLL